MTAPQEQHGLVCVFPGVGTGVWHMGRVCQAYRDAGVVADVRIKKWDTPVFNALGHLVNYDRNRAHAAVVAAEIAQYRQAHPAAAIDLVGYSAGGGKAVMVVEALPEDIRLRNVVLVQAALSPTYDLTEALRHVEGKLVNLYSPGDWFILGLGTKVFGTIDRTRTASAGKNGFDLVAAVPNETLRSKVVQRGWTREWLRRGHVGTHLSSLLYRWNRTYVAPYLLSEDAASVGSPAGAAVP